MYWAKDRLGNIVHASARLPYSADFRCPCCSAPVFLRAGSYRQAHFAHYGYTGTDECEYYYPSDEAGAPPVRSPIEPPKAEREQPFVRAGIFLTRTGRGVSLVLRLPRLRDAANESAGKVVIQTGLGKSEIESSHLARTHFVTLVPGVPIATASATQELADVQASISHAIENFREDGNFFSATDGSGALLPPAAPLEWGEQYLLITKRTRQLYAPDSLGFHFDGERRGWFYYRIELPDSTLASEAAQAQIARFLGRTVRTPRPRVRVVFPAPHHVAPDGALVYPEDTTQVVLHGYGLDSVSVSTVYGREPIPVDALDSEFFSIRTMGEDLKVLLEDREQFELRFEACVLFQPPGIELVVQEEARPLFDADLREWLLSKPGSVRVRSPSAMMLDAMRLEPDRWERRGAEYLFEGEHDAIAIEAGAFGRVLRISHLSKPSLPLQGDTGSPANESQMKWISWISVKEDGVPRSLKSRAEPAERAELNGSWRALYKRRTQ